MLIRLHHFTIMRMRIRIQLAVGCGLLESVLGIRNRVCRIRMFLGLLDPDPLVRGTDPDPALDLALDPTPDPYLVLINADWNNACKIKCFKKIFEKNKFFCLKMICLWASNKKNMKTNFFLFASLKSTNKVVGSGVGSISQRYGSGDPDLDPDPHHNVPLQTLTSKTTR